MKTNFLCFILIVSALNHFEIHSQSPANFPEEVSAVVAATSMNVLYIGADNPVKIAVPGFRPEQVTATGCGIQHSKGEEYIATPTKVGLDTIQVSVATKKGEKIYNETFRIRRIPDPYLYIGKVKGGIIHAGELKACEKIWVGNPDFVFDLPYEIVSFEMVYAPKTGNVVSDVSNNSSFTKLMKDMIAKAKPGDIFVVQAVVKMPDSRSVPLNTSFKIIS